MCGQLGRRGSNPAAAFLFYHDCQNGRPAAAPVKMAVLRFC
ncbi:MAG: hypothetical protein ACK55Z_14400 [bacterium]